MPHLYKITLKQNCGHEQNHFLPMREAFQKKRLAALADRSCNECSMKNQRELSGEVGEKSADSTEE